MKYLFILVAMSVALSAAAQLDHDDPSDEKMVDFSSVLLDFEVLNGKLVALTKRKREYFIYYTNPEGVELYQSLELKYLSELFVDCMGNLYVTSIDSAFRLTVSSFVQVEEGVDLPSYRKSIKNCEAIFDHTLVRTGENNALLIEPLSDADFAQTPVLNVIQHYSSQAVYVHDADRGKSGQRSDTGLDRTLTNNQSANNGYQTISRDANGDEIVQARTSPNALPPVAKTKSSTRTVVSYKELPDEINGYKVGDSLWVVDKTKGALFVYSNEGVLRRFSKLDGFQSADEVVYDAKNESIYLISMDYSQMNIHQLGANGEMDLRYGANIVGKRKKLVVNDGFLYFVTTNGAMESISRTALHL